MPCPTTGVGITSNVLPPQRHSSAPRVRVVGARTRSWLLTMISSWPPTRMAIGVPQPTSASRASATSACRSRVERRDERRRALILIEDDAILVEQRRAGRAVIVVDRAEVAMPDQLAVHIDGHQAARAERGVDALAVGGRRRRGVAVLRRARARSARRRQRLPQPACRRRDRTPAATGGVRRRAPSSGRCGRPRRSATSCRCRAPASSRARSPCPTTCRDSRCRRRGPGRTAPASAASTSPPPPGRRSSGRPARGPCAASRARLVRSTVTPSMSSTMRRERSPRLDPSHYFALR